MPAPMPSWPAIRTFTRWRASSKPGVDKSLNDLRDKRLMTFDSDKLTRVGLAGQGTAGRVRQEQPERMDHREAAAVARRQLAGGHADRQVEGRQDGPAEPRRGCRQEVRCGAPKSRPPPSPMPAVRKRSKSGRIKTRTTTPRAPRWRASTRSPADVGDALNKSLDDFRNKKLFDFGFSDPTKVDVKNGRRPPVHQERRQMDVRRQDHGQLHCAEPDRQTARSDAPPSSRKRAAGSRFSRPPSHPTAANAPKRSPSPSREINISRNARASPSIYELDKSAVEDLQKAATDVKEAPPEARQEEMKAARMDPRAMLTADERPSYRPLRAHHGRRLLRRPARPKRRPLSNSPSAGCPRTAISFWRPGCRRWWITF